MKHKIKTAVCVIIVLAILIPVVLEFGTGHVNKTELEVGTSQMYTEQEIKEASKALKLYFFLHMRGFELQEISYQEEASHFLAQEMTQKGRIKSEKCMIVFESKFRKVHGSDNNDAYGEMESGYQWILIRDKEGGRWHIDESMCGYG